jgi:hypothetical protein
VFIILLPILHSMNKRLLLSVLFTGISWLSFAQGPVLTWANMNIVTGDRYAVHNCSPNNIVPGPGGADTSWNFSTLITLSQGVDTATAILAASTQTHAIFPASTTGILMSGSPAINYYIENDTVLSQDGNYISSGNYTAYSNPIDQLQFPFAFNNTFTSYYSGLIVSTPAGDSATYTIINGSNTVTADAYGTLTLPGTTGPVVYSNVLRTHGIQSYTDSVGVAGASLLAYTVETYTWYTPNYHYPLLTIATTTGSGVYSTKVFYSDVQVTGDASVSSMSPAGASFELFPNPVNGLLNIAYNTPGNEHVRITLSDMLGREVAVIANGYTQGAQQLGYNTTTLPKGLYLVRFQTTQESITRKVEIR